MLDGQSPQPIGSAKGKQPDKPESLFFCRFTECKGTKDETFKRNEHLKDHLEDVHYMEEPEVDKHMIDSFGPRLRNSIALENRLERLENRRKSDRAGWVHVQ
jgi:hypothetical protein